MGRLRLAPSAKGLVDRDKRRLREFGRILRIGMLRFARAVMMPGDDALRLRRIQEPQIGLGDSARALRIDIAIHHRDRRLREDRDGRNNDLELVRAKLGECQERLVLPGQEHIANAALREGRRRSPRCRVEHRHIAQKRRDIRPHLRLILVEGALRKGPGRKIVPARPAARLRVRRDHRNAGLHQIGPVLHTLRIALAHKEHDGRGIGRGIVRQARLPVLRSFPVRAAIASMSPANASVTTSAFSPSITARAWLPDPPCDCRIETA